MIAQLAHGGVEPPVVVDGQDGPGIVTRRHHPLCIRNQGGDRFFAVDGANPSFSAGDCDFGVDRGIGGHADDVECFPGEHLFPVGIGLDARALREAFPPSGVAAGTGYQINAGMVGQGTHVRAVQMANLLSQGVSGDLIGSADISKSDDARTVSCFAHGISVLVWGMRDQGTSSTIWWL